MHNRQCQDSVAIVLIASGQSFDASGIVLWSSSDYVHWVQNSDGHLVWFLATSKPTFEALEPAISQVPLMTNRFLNHPREPQARMCPAYARDLSV